MLGDLDLFSEPLSAGLTFLRIFLSIPFMLDVEELYSGEHVRHRAVKSSTKSVGFLTAPESSRILQKYRGTVGLFIVLNGDPLRNTFWNMA